MKYLPFALICVVSLLNVGCGTAPAGQNGGIAGTGIHSEVSTTVGPNGETGPVQIKIYAARRPLSPNEKKEAHDLAFKSGADYATELAEASNRTVISVARAKANCFRNLTYRYRVDKAHNEAIFDKLKQISNSGFDDGYKSVATP